MAADGRPDGRAQDAQAGILVTEPLGKGVAVVGAVGVADRHHRPEVVVAVVLLVVLEHLLHGLLTPARHAQEGELAIELPGEQGLRVEQVGRHAGRLGDTTTAVQRVEVVHHEDRMGEVGGLLAPGHELLGRKASVALADGFLHIKVLGGGSDLGVHDVDRGGQLAAHFLGEAVACRAGTVIGTRDARGNADHDGGHATLLHLAEGLLVHRLAGLAGHGRGAATDHLVEVVG